MLVLNPRSFFLNTDENILIVSKYYLLSKRVSMYQVNVSTVLKQEVGGIILSLTVYVDLIAIQYNLQTVKIDETIIMLTVNS